MKRRIESERLGAGEKASLNLKLGPGGLSDVEFCVQLLQLRHGAEQPSVRVPSTRQALATLTAAGILDSVDGAVLGARLPVVRSGPEQALPPVGAGHRHPSERRTGGPRPGTRHGLQRPARRRTPCGPRRADGLAHAKWWSASSTRQTSDLSAPAPLYGVLVPTEHEPWVRPSSTSRTRGDGDAG